MKVKLEQFIYNLRQEKDQWVLFFPVFLACGIGVYFAIDWKLNYFILASLFLLNFILARYFYGGLKMLVFAALAIAIFGFSVAHFYEKKFDVPVLTDKYKVFDVIGKVEEVKIYQKYNLEEEDKTAIRLIIKNPKIWGLPPRRKNQTELETLIENPPVKIRVNISKKHFNQQIQAGDIVKIRALLLAPMKPNIVGGYDFSKAAYFKQIGAVGRSLSPVGLLKKGKNNPILLKIENLRQIISKKIMDSADARPASLISVLLVGVRGLVEFEDMQNMRRAGLAHLLSISGLHLSLVTGFIFLLARTILGYSSYLNLHFNLKKIAAIIAIMGGLFYLLISGTSLPAIRAFTMVLFVLSAILLDRVPSPLRSIALAASIILLLWPYVLLTPSFQMSFVAVTILVASFQILIKYPIFAPPQGSIIRKVPNYILCCITSSAIAEIAIAPFAIFHFNQYSQLGILANLAAIPLTAFIIMPLLILSLPLMLLGLEKLTLWPAAQAIELLLNVAAKVSSITISSHLTPAIPLISLLFIAAGGIWFCLWQRNWRFLGFGAIFIGILLGFNKDIPDVILDNRGTNFAIIANDKFIFSNSTKSNFIQDSWSRQLGFEEFHKFKDFEPSEQFGCQDFKCWFKKNDQEIVILEKKYQGNCPDADFLVDLRKKDTCPDSLSRNDLRQNGPRNLYFDDLQGADSRLREEG